MNCELDEPIGAMLRSFSQLLSLRMQGTLTEGEGLARLTNLLR
jgi:hypothetical protein